jgi:hypothetical protein
MFRNLQNGTSSVFGEHFGNLLHVFIFMTSGVTAYLQSNFPLRLNPGIDTKVRVVLLALRMKVVLSI